MGWTDIWIPIESTCLEGDTCMRRHVQVEYSGVPGTNPVSWHVKYIRTH